MKSRLFTPGPTPVPERVALRMASPLIHHRTDEFRQILARVHTHLQTLFQTSQPVLPLTCSGTGAMEAVVVNCFSPGDTVVTVNGGKFGQRWTELAATFGLKPVEITVPWGNAVQPDEVRRVLAQHPHARGILLTHSETSTGTTVHLQAIASAIRLENPAVLLCVDAITSIGAHELRFDSWGLDVCVTGSQKGIMVPPGLAFLALSERAVSAVQASTMPRFYFDLRRALASFATGNTPWTPAITLIAGADEGLQMILAEGMEAVWRRHARHAAAVRAGLEAMGLTLFSHSPSHAVTAVWLPDGIMWREFRDALANRFGVTVAGGQGDVAGRIFRISHLGYYDDLDMVSVVAAVERALLLCGMDVQVGKGVEAVHRALSEDDSGGKVGEPGVGSML